MSNTTAKTMTKTPTASHKVAKPTGKPPVPAKPPVKKK